MSVFLSVKGKEEKHNNSMNGPCLSLVERRILRLGVRKTTALLSY